MGEKRETPPDISWRGRPISDISRAKARANVLKVVFRLTAKSDGMRISLLSMHANNISGSHVERY